MILGVYAGTFDPPTYGHLDVIKRASSLFDKVIVGVSVNPRKSPVFSTEERVAMLQEACRGMANVTVEVVPGLLVDFARKAGAHVIVRGLRAVSDFETELQMASINRELAPEVETVFFTPAPQYHYLSASLVCEIARFGGSTSEFVPPHVERALKNRFSGEDPAAPGPRGREGSPSKS